MNIFKKIRSIFHGYVNLIFKTDYVEKIAKKRADICIKCPHLKMSNIDIVWDTENPKVSGRHCGICDCPIPAKIRSLEESCPDGRWDSEL